MVDNFDVFKKLMSFNSEDEFYFLQIIQRKKDNKDSSKRLGRNNSCRIIKSYSITSIEKLNEYKGEIIALCNMFNARACIGVNKRSFKFASFEMLKQLSHSLQSKNYNNAKLWNSVCGIYWPNKDKTWLIDVDNLGRRLNDIILFAERKCLPEGSKYITTIPSKSGYHILMKPFNLETFKKEFPEIDVHKNNPTNLYIP